ncbi:MAG: creatininase [Mesorhizobium sp.]|uniref:creatininase n=1 Tax=Mesorhizobium sp. M1A.F.Ca.IN.020.06.1.1 TaxID=2496765 RepID=UPI001220F3B3|nr:creatininase [Mesorhizobium sp. M1A.F.Ca.IN.020.06.1.1]TIR98891.1 MAG: creatininase [Mesorhizobium sp.]TIS98961.1 MAG: creatininase [Mesorhizobium sp.]TJV09274.1 MAG: creatininase [Mesorhizobium sp.]
MDEEFRIANMNWMSYRDRISRTESVVLVPIGSVEQHGPHLPLATDSLIPTAICEHCARHSGALVAPTLSYGARSTPRCGGGQHFCGTTSIDASTLIIQIRDLVREFTRHGVKNLAFVVGHMENTWFVNEACELALRDAKMMGAEPPRMMAVGYWEFLTQKTIDHVFADKFPNWALEHAGIMETSMMLHIHPELVHMDTLIEHGPSRLPVYDMWPYDQSLIPADGVLNTAIGSTSERGKIFFDEFTSSLSAALGREFGR